MQFGDKAKDIVSGFEGVVTGSARYMTGDSRTQLTQTSTEGGEVKENWFDDSRLVVTAENHITLPPIASKV